MQKHQDSLKSILSLILLWIATGRVLRNASAFLQDSRTNKPPGRNMVGPILDDEENGLLIETISIEKRHTSLAHGIMCPDTIAKMERATHGGNNRAVKAFLDRYHRHGPMSCMKLLSDPEILPHLTSTMRDLT